LDRTEFIAALANRVAARAHEGVLRVGIDGLDGAGKTRLADELANELRSVGHTVIRAGVDGFHNPRAVRYRLGRDSPEGFYRDTTNIRLLRDVLLDPLSPGGTGQYRVRAFDHRTDAPISELPATAVPPAILVFDGIFLHRTELCGYWDLSIFLDVPFAESYARMSRRDGSDPDPQAVDNRRYLEGQKLYLAECSPRERADVVVDYAVLEAPRIVVE
jgi:uridine kinase